MPVPVNSDVMLALATRKAIVNKKLMGEIRPNHQLIKQTGPNGNSYLV